MRNFFKDKDVQKQICIYGGSGICVVIFYLLMANIPSVMGILDDVIGVLMPFVWGIVFYILLVNVSNFIEKHLPDSMNKSIKRKIGASLSIVFLIAVIVIFFLILLPQLVQSITRLVENIQMYITNLTAWLDSLELENYLNQEAVDYIENSGRDLINRLVAFLSDRLPQIFGTVYGALNNLFSIVVGIVICAYILFDRENIHTQFTKLGKAFLKRGHVEAITRILSKGLENFNRFIRGQLIDAMIVGILCFVAMSILNLDYALLISTICAITNVIPIFGPFIGAIPSAFILLIVDPMQCLKFVIMITVLQQIDGNIICPKILGDTIGLSKIWIMFAITVGGGFFGIVGMFFGVPVFSLFYSLLSEYTHLRIERKKADNPPNQ